MTDQFMIKESLAESLHQKTMGNFIFYLSHLYPTDDPCKILRDVLRVMTEFDDCSLSNNYWLIMRLQIIVKNAIHFSSSVTQSRESLMFGIYK